MRIHGQPFAESARDLLHRGEASPGGEGVGVAAFRMRAVGQVDPVDQFATTVAVAAKISSKSGWTAASSVTHRYRRMPSLSTTKTERLASPA